MDKRALFLFALFFAAAAVPGAVACSSSSSGNSGTTPPPNPQSPPLLGEDCDPIEPVATECGFPYPSNVWTIPDKTTPTGLHQFYGPTSLPLYQAPNKHVTPTPWERKDGFSPGSAIMAFWPDVDVSKLPSLTTLPSSTTTSSPTIVMEYATGNLVPHWDEVDMLPTTEDGERAFFIRPAIRLKDATRYLVAIRHLTDSTGAAIQPSPAFQALRDGSASNDVSVSLRRNLYKDILGTLQKNGVQTGDLIMAWDFTTASKENTTSDMVSIRDQALAAVGADGPTYTITKVTDNPNPYIRRRIQGNMTVPLYLTTPSTCPMVNGQLEPGCPGSDINRDASGKPAQNGTADYPFLVQIPNSVVNLGTTAPILQNAHGLFGDQTEGEDSYMAEICDRLHYIEIAVDLVGMDSEDGNWIPNAIAGDMANFAHLPDRLHQGFANELMAMRMMMGKMATDPQTMPAGKPTIDPTQRFYRGDSQGGISGGVYMAISTDVTRGLLDNTGGSYEISLDRSRDFTPFFLTLRGVYPDPAQEQLLIDLIQQLWDNAEPDGYMTYISESMLPCPTAICPSGVTPAHNVIIMDGLGDQQVSPISAQYEARSIGAKNLQPVNREVWGISDAPSGFTGNGYVEFNFWEPASQSPLTNTPPPINYPGCSCIYNGQVQNQCGSDTCDTDPHDELRKLQWAQDMVDQFFKTGQINQTCPGGGPCAAPMGWSTGAPMSDNVAPCNIPSGIDPGLDGGPGAISCADAGSD